jgi:hypothetical protein
MQGAGEVVTVVTPGTTVDTYSGQASPDWVHTTTRDVATLAPPEPRPSEEPVEDARNAVVSGWTLYLPAGTTISPYERVRVRGIDYPVQGEPAVWGSKGVVVQAFRTEG